ncbi:hypothetical protein BH11ACT7_BH11ACT7_01710 [soil metagenome]
MPIDVRPAQCGPVGRGEVIDEELHLEMADRMARIRCPQLKPKIAVVVARVPRFVDTEQLQAGDLIEACGVVHVGDEEGEFENFNRHSHRQS